MRNESEIRCRIHISKSRESRSECHKAGYRGACLRAEPVAVGSQHHTVSVFIHKPHVYVQTGAGFAGCDFRSEGYVEAFLCSKIANDPLREHKLIGSLAGIDRQEFYFILLIYFAVESEIAHFGVSVFDFAACRRYILHTTRAEIVEFGKRCRFMVATLIGGREVSGVVGNYIIFELAHCVKHVAGLRGKSLACFGKCMLRRTLKRPAFEVEKRAQHSECRYFGKGVAESRAEARYHIQVGTSGADKRKK